MRGKKTDIETKAKIIEERINTFWSSRDIEQSTGIPHETVAKVLREEFTQVCTESEKVASLIDTNNNLQSLADKRLKEMLADWEETVRISELVQVRESTFKQNQLLKWENTEIVQVSWYDLLKKISSWEIWSDEAYKLMDQVENNL